MPSRYIIVLILLVPFILAFILQYFTGRIEHGGFDFISVFLLCILGLWWTIRDSAERNICIPDYLRFLLLVITVVRLPLYLFRARGGRGGLVATIATTSVVALYCVSFTLGRMAGEHSASFVDKKTWNRCAARDSLSPDQRIESCTTLIELQRAWKHKKAAAAH